MSVDNALQTLQSAGFKVSVDNGSVDDTQNFNNDMIVSRQSVGKEGAEIWIKKNSEIKLYTYTELADTSDKNTSLKTRMKIPQRQ
jgi:hypothetical protein